MRTQENKEKYKEYDHKYYIKYKRPKTKIGQAEAKIDQLKQQLAEKQNTIDEINKEFVQSIHDWKALCAEKDKEIEKIKTKQKPIVMHSKENYYFLEEENIKLHFVQKQLAIQELEKVKDTLKHFCNIHNDEYYGVKSQVKGIEQNVCESIDNQIKILKGE